MNSNFLRISIFIAVLITAGLYWYYHRPHRIETPGLTHHLVYLEKTINSQSNRDELPMLIMLHGAGDTAENFLSWYDDFKAPVRIIVFQGPFDYGRGYTWAGRKGVEDTVSVAQSINASINELLDTYPTKGKPMVFGFSRGAILAYYLAISSEQYSYVVPVSGYLDTQLLPAETGTYFEYPGIYAFHGTRDQVISIAQDRSSIQSLQRLNIKATLAEYPSRHLPDEQMQQAIKQQISSLLSELQGTSD